MIPPAKAQFVFASWNDDDGNGQGISAVYVHENSTGVWLPVLEPAFVLPEEDTIIAMNESENTAIRLYPTYTLSHVVHDLPSPEDGMNIMRSSIIVKVLGAVVFSQDNLTLVYGGIQTDTTYWYWASIIIPILIRSGVIYAVELTYEIYPYLYE